MDGIKQCCDKLKAYEGVKNALLDEMLGHLKILTDQQRQLRKELEEAKNVSATYTKKWEEACTRVDALTKIGAAEPFTLVLVDGDGLPFTDEHVKRGSEGGEQAARALRNTIIEYLQHDQNIPAGTKTVIRVFANIAGLGKAYCEHGILPNPHDINPFVRGFNKYTPLCDYVDAGDDKEAADNKIKETFKLFYDNIHCKHIALGCSTDDSFAGFLRNYRVTGKINPQISLIRGPPFAPALRQLTSGFRTPPIPFDHVLRPAKIGAADLNNKSWNSKVTTTRTTSIPVKRSLSPGLEDTDQACPSKPQDRKAYIYLNNDGKRVDDHLDYDVRLVAPMRSRTPRFCNNHYLNGFCPQPHCAYEHSVRLERTELETLRHIARGIPCNTVFCKNPYCTCGHQCRHGVDCTRRDCNFPKDMHDVDLSTARLVEVGT